MSKLYTFFKTFFVLLIIVLGISSASCGGGGGGGSDSSDTGIDDTDINPTLVDPIFVRTGINSSTVIDQEYRTTVFVGRYLYQEEESEFDLSFNPNKNFLKDLDFDD